METPRKVLKNIHLTNVQQQDTGGASSFKVPASPLMKNLGYGTGVNVYCLERSPGTTGQIRSPWAIKRVSKVTRITNKFHSKLFNERIVKEADILRQLKHPNIIGFRALTKENEDMDALALECCKTSLGSLLEDRLDNEESALPANYIIRILNDVASALHYLHTEAMLLHGDVKSHNILVKGDFEICKLCDFGVSLPLDKQGKVNFRENPHLEYVGTDLWCSPEVIAEEDVIDSKSEIFSLGLVIYETITLRPPHLLEITADDDEENDECAASGADVGPGNMTRLGMLYGTRPTLPQAFDLGNEYNIVMELFYLCTNEIPADRPSASIICTSLRDKDDRLTSN